MSESCSSEVSASDRNSITRKRPTARAPGDVALAVVCPGNVPLALFCNETQFHASVGHFWEEAPEGHVHVSGKDAAAASAAFRQAVVETLAWFSVSFGMIVVQVEDSDEHLHAIEDGLVPLHLRRQDATPSAL